MDKLLIIEDDPLFSHLLSEALEPLGFQAAVASHHAQALEFLHERTPFTHCLLDLGLPSGSGLTLITPLLNYNPDLKIVVLTGFANVPTAVEAIKLGALYYLSKPVEIQHILEAFERTQGDATQPLNTVSDLDSREREHVQAILQKNHFNISASARELGLHRRTLQRKLAKWGLRSED